MAYDVVQLGDIVRRLLDAEPRFHRYAIASRKLPELRRVRASFVGRAIHTLLDAWQKQVDTLPAGF